jgi:hypothetical protein
VFINNDYKEVSRVHYSVLHSTKLMEPYIEEHLAIITVERTAQATPNFMVEGQEHTT